VANALCPPNDVPPDSTIDGWLTEWAQVSVGMPC